MKRRHRVGVVVALLVLQGALGVAFGAMYPDADRPGYGAGASDLAAGDVAAGETVALHVRVVATDPVVVETALGTRLGLRSAPERLEVDDAVELVGRYQGDGSVATTGVTIHDETGVWFAYVVSFGAGLLVLVLAVRRWRFDATDWSFRFRRDGRGGRP